jgi:hypothetical protein
VAQPTRSDRALTVQATPKVSRRRLLLWVGLGVGLAGGAFSYSGFVMAGSFTVSNPERIEHWKRVAHIYLALTIACGLIVLATAIALYRGRQRGGTMRITPVLLAAAVIFGMPTAGAAQGPAPSVLWQRPAPGPSAARVAVISEAARAPDHRWEGMAIGAGAGALAFGVLAAGLCSQSESTDSCTGIVVGTALLGAFVGGVTGGLIGGSIPKGEPADSTSEPN